MTNEDLGRFYASKNDSKNSNDKFVRLSVLREVFDHPETMYADDEGIKIFYPYGIELNIPLVGGDGIIVDVNEDMTAIEIHLDRT